MAIFPVGLVLLVVIIECSLADAKNVTVVTDIGTFIGKTETVKNRDLTMNVSNFLGIRYAEPPVGQLRFRVPIAKSPFNEAQTVQNFGSECIGLRSNYDGSEDCLFLNVFVPDKTDAEALAVMIYFHGGSFNSGTSEGYDSNVLAALGHVIVVTVNYRLSVWGFLCTGDSNWPGNYGLWDQHLAIQWVADNIKKFGGDEKRITLFGESAGAVAAFHQALFPPNKDLFKRVIAQSGSVSAFWGFTYSHINEGKVVAKALGCDTADTSKMMDCLQNLPAEAISSELNNDSSSLAPYIRGMFLPCRDGAFVKVTPLEFYDMSVSQGDVQVARDTFASFDFLSGINSGEGAYLVALVYGNIESFLPANEFLYNNFIPLFTEEYFGDLSNGSKLIIHESLISEYTDWSDVENRVKVRDNLLQMYSDYSFFIPLARSLNLHSSLSQKKTYMYYLDTVITNHVLSTPSWSQKPNHADDLFFIFPSNQFFSSSHFTESDRMVAENIITLWSNFVKTGDTNLPNDLELSWLPYTPTRHSYLRITRNLTSANVKERLFEDKVNFWTRVIPTIASLETVVCNETDSNQTSMTAKMHTSVLTIFITFLWISLRPLCNFI